jgi:type III secretory pathway component EscV
MAPTASDLHSDRPFSHLHPAPATAVITDARGAASKELSSRMRRYTIAMAFRLACFIGMAFVDGWLRWTLLAFAVFLPYIAVVLANQSDQRTVASQVEHGAPQDAPALTTGAEGVVLSGDVISGEVVDDDPVDEYSRPAA